MCFKITNFVHVFIFTKRLLKKKKCICTKSDSCLDWGFHDTCLNYNASDSETIIDLVLAPNLASLSASLFFSLAHGKTMLDP